MSAGGERFLVTGALGCIGAWTCAVLAESGASVVGFDLGTDDRRLRLVGAGDVPVIRGDITDRAALDRLLDEHAITHVIHLAALLIPQIKASPPRGTAINVGGTVNVLDAAKTRDIQRRVRQLGRGLLAGGRPRRAGAERRDRASDDLLRRPQAGLRGPRAHLLAGGAGRLDRHPPLHRLRTRAGTPG